MPDAFRVAAMPCCMFSAEMGRLTSQPCHTPLHGYRAPSFRLFDKRAVSNVTWFFLALNLSPLGLEEELSDRHYSLLKTILPLQY